VVKEPTQGNPVPHLQIIAHKNIKKGIYTVQLVQIIPLLQSESKKSVVKEPTQGNPVPHLQIIAQGLPHLKCLKNSGER